MSHSPSPVVVITGASGNLGSAAAEVFAAAGARLALFDRTPDRALALAERLGLDTCLAVPVDVLDPDSVATAVHTVTERWGRIDVLLNLVGGFAMGTPVHDTDLRIWQRMHNLNGTSVFLMAAAVAPVMIAQGGGHIINVGARPPLTPARKNMAAYRSSKAVTLSLTESLDAELRPHGINVNAIVPSIIDTPQNRDAMPDSDPTRWVTPQALARVMRWLTTPDAAPIHGAILPVYGDS